MKKVGLLLIIFLLIACTVGCDTKEKETDDTGAETGSTQSSTDLSENATESGTQDSTDASENATESGTQDSTDASENTTESGTQGGDIQNPAVIIRFNGNGGNVTVEYVEIEYGGRLAYSDLPSATREGYILKGWSYDLFGNDLWSARNDTFTDAETILFAVWEKESSGTTDSSNQGGSNPVPDDMIKIEFNTGTGYFEEPDNYEILIKSGSRIPSFPTPVHSNPAMLFEGWFMDEEYTIAASPSTKHESDTMLYAKWEERVQCNDGSYIHVWGSWDTETKPSCTKDGTTSRYCTLCGNKDIKNGDPALGHKWNSWEEAFMRKERTCARLGCTDKEIVEYEDITIPVLGDAPGRQISGNSEAFYNVPFTNMINGRWDDGYGEVVSLRGNGMAYVQFDLIAPSVIDRIYFKGVGVTAINVFVKYEGDEEFTLVGVCSSAPEKELTPFVSPDSAKNVVAIKFVEDCPPQGASMWQEVAFVKIVD